MYQVFVLITSFRSFIVAINTTTIPPQSYRISLTSVWNSPSCSRFAKKHRTCIISISAIFRSASVDVSSKVIAKVPEDIFDFTPGISLCYCLCQLLIHKNLKHDAFSAQIHIPTWYRNIGMYERALFYMAYFDKLFYMGGIYAPHRTSKLFIRSSW